jgi:hypothetical protein
VEIFRVDVWRTMPPKQQGKVHGIAVLIGVLAATLASPLGGGWVTVAGFMIGWPLGAELGLRVTQPNEDRGTGRR